MSQPAGLAFEQAPPFSLPLRFFLTAPLFLLAAAILIVLAPEALASRWTPQALAMTHALTLGFLAMVMSGALMQMLPVVAGSPLPAPRFVAWVSHTSLTLGTIALMTGFMTSAPTAFGISLTLLGTGFFALLLATTISLVRATHGDTVTGIRLGTVSLTATLFFGFILVMVRTGWWMPPVAEIALNAHIAFGLLGWVLLLVIGVAYQVVPMFQITPPYPPRLSRWLAPALFALLVVHIAAPLFFPRTTYFVDTLLASGLLIFALTTIRLQLRRRRKLPDVTLAFWRLGMGSLIACMVVWLAAQSWPVWKGSTAYPQLLGILFIGGFAISVVNGMLYKIVPFLAWFHLQAQLQARAGSIPTMKDMIAERWMRWQFRLHLAACLLLAAAALWPKLAVIAGTTLTFSASLLGFNLFAAIRRYTHHGGRFN